MVSKFAIAACLILCGCTTTGHQRVAGWPTDWKVTYHKVAFSEVVDKCSKYSPWWAWPPLACTEFFKDHSAHVWYVWDSQLEHEQEHIAGYEHPGGDGLKQILKAINGL